MYRYSLPREAAAQIVPVRHLRTARRIAAKERPDTVHNLDELFEALSELDLIGVNRTQDNEPIIAIRCQNHDSVVITSRRQLGTALTTTSFQADATYQIFPTDLGRQLFCIHGSWGRHVRRTVTELEFFPLCTSMLFSRAYLNWTLPLLDWTDSVCLHEVRV